jgi:hypothetical protein
MKLNIYNWPYVDVESPGGRNPVSADELMHTMKDLREVLLKESDWTVGNDSPLSESDRQAWIEWRQWMRDISAHCSPLAGDKWVEIPDPPRASPKSWVNVTYVESDEIGV